MIIQTGNMFDYEHKLDYMCITTNAVITKAGDLVMGAGIAKAAKIRDPQLPKLFAQQIQIKHNDYRTNILLPDYYLVSVGKYIAFQTKRDWKDKSPLDLVIASIQRLERLAHKYPDRKFGLPFPGCSNGGLKKEDVLPYLRHLPHNVTVFQNI